MSAVYIDGYLIDAFLKETHKREAEVTQFKMESGSTTTDNVYIKPVTVQITAIVSNTPMPGPVAQARQNANPGTDAAGDLSFLPSDEALARVEATFLAKLPITLVTGLKTYESMLMSDLEIEVDETTGNALSFTASFTQATFVSNARTTIKVSPRLLAATTVTKAKPPGMKANGKTGTGARFDQATNQWVYTGGDLEGQPLSAEDTPNAQDFGTPLTAPTLDPATNTWTDQNGATFTDSPGANVDTAQHGLTPAGQEAASGWYNDAQNVPTIGNGNL